MESSHLPLSIAIILLMIVLFDLSHIATTQPINDTQFIETTCQSTPYPDLCLSSLSAEAAAAIHSSYRLMTVAVLTITLEQMRSASSEFVSLANSNVLSPRESYALSDCIEEFGDSIEELKMAIAELNDSNKTRLEIEDIQTQVSTALTDDDTCTDGFAGDDMDGRVKELVKALIKDVGKLISIALSLIKHLK